MERHAALIADAAGHTRVTAVDQAGAVRRHYAEALELLRISDDFAENSNITIDVGSGGGYPGMVMAILRPDSTYHLVEPLQKRARLLETISAELGLGNVAVHASRAEDAGRGPLRDTAGLVTARAVAALPELLEYTAPLAASGGWLALPKGSGYPEELAAASNAMTELGCRHHATVPMRPEINEAAVVMVFEKVQATPPRYPRRPGIPAKRPL